VAVLQADPGAVLLRFSDEPGGDDALALAERNGVELVAVEALVLGELEKLGHGVSARGKDEDEWNDAVGVAVGLDEVEGRGLGELLAQVALDELGDG